MDIKTPVSIGITGLGGYAGAICRLLRECSASPDPQVRLAAVCEPNLDAHAETASQLRAEGVLVSSRWEDLLAQPIESVWLPLPIPLHRPYTEQALQAGLAVMCEKPAAGCVQDLDAMMLAQKSAGLPVAFGFQDIYEPSTLAMKRALLAQEIGAVRSATLTACWPRGSDYYERSAWAGRQQQAGAWVMDSPASNALAHFVNLALFLLGESESETAGLSSIDAELYRANPIENYDTCGLRITTAADVPFLVLLTHASQQTQEPRIVIYGERGTLIYVFGGSAELRTENSSRTFSLQSASRVHMVERFANLVRGVADERLVATPEIARAHLILVHGASEASPVRSIPHPFVQTRQTAKGNTHRAIDGIEELFQDCAREQNLPHETGLASWTSPAGRCDLKNYAYFAGPAKAKV